MNLKIQFDCANINWDLVSGTLKMVGMATYAAEIHKKAFENSHTVVFIFDDDRLIGFGRAISDGAYQGAIYDVAILPEYQGQGIGRMIVDSIKKSLQNCNLILYAAPGKEQFYEKLNFKRMKTGMALFCNAADMQKRGFTE
ncbi:acetyltransferase [Desulfosporosinus orientis DSM 765]|uniref:Acetyltransferase n=1 Tax=Desulfosporosinus orientis (strain ATCC 19365 / DSM 765 / NCIMB 8382 / VKM B-1628 / Singapore I) TaxID=768706 RepID=G7WFF8_DESOD|nr:GNAT family N-acetyltransferase [Desulfosporosinus orientis]AET68401.1 acetyltransferase [Desulfosporosinus orientis DSM 765]